MAEKSMPTEIEYTSPSNLDELIAIKLEYENSKKGDLNRDEYDCEQCNNRGFYYVQNPESEYAWDLAMVVCRCMEVRENLTQAKKSGLGSLLDHRVKDFKIDNQWRNDDGSNWQKDFKDLVTDYILNADKEWFLALGQSGTGKTMLCSAICNERLKKGHEVVYVIWRDYADNMKQMKFEKKFIGNNRKHYYNEHAEAEILYIDDLFKGTITATDKSYAFELINHRYNQKLVTIVSSELLIAELMEVDQAVAGRLKEAAGRYVFPIGKDVNKNYRLK